MKEKPKSFEERLERLEHLGDEVRRNDIPLEEALMVFEEGIKLARSLEKDLEKVESRVEMLRNGSEAKAGLQSGDESPELELFS